MKKILLTNRVDPSVKDALRRHSQLLNVPMNKLVEQSIMEHIVKTKPELQVKIWHEFGSK